MDSEVRLSSFYRRKQDIQRKRRQIQRIFQLRHPPNHHDNILTLGRKDLKYLFYCYDRYFFSWFFAQHFPGRLAFSFSSRMTRSAGKIIYPRSFQSMDLRDVTLEIRMAQEVFLNYYHLCKNNVVNGIKTKSVFEAFLLVFEHEICHLLELLFYRKTSCKGERFKELAYHLFAHTDVYHQLPLGKDIAWEKYGLKIGDTVTFRHQEQCLTGYIKRITKRATVIVPDPHGDHIQDGVQCSIWYVPLVILTKG